MDRKSWIQLILEIFMFAAQSVTTVLNRQDVQKTPK